MPFRFRLAVCRSACLAVLLALPLPAVAQDWVGVGRWGSDRQFRYVAPGTWMVDQREGSTAITAEGDNHDGRIEIRCDADAPAGRMRFSLYRGEALNDSVFSDSEPRTQRVRISVDGQAFDREFTYRPADRDWIAEGFLDESLLDAFGWGTRMELLNEAGERITAYRLRGSGAARSAVRETCGI